MSESESEPLLLEELEELELDELEESENKLLDIVD